jgi:uncharacterized protein YdaU (DUF1376 family)
MLMHYFQFHIGDYKSHTHHLTVIEDIAYRRLLDHYYLHEAPIKQRDIARQIGMRDHEQEVLSVLNEFFVSTEEGFINARADRAIAEYHGKKEQASKAGKASAERRLNARSTDVQPTTNQEPLTTNHKPITIKKTVAPPFGVTESVWQDWITLRKSKKAAVTQTALDGIEREARKAGVSLQTALETCCARGWTGFKAEWMEEKMTPAQKAQNNMHQLTRGLTAPKPFWAKPAEVDNDRLLR